jgi:hypothetical protein
MDLFDRGRIPSASPTRQQPQQTDPLLTVDPSIGLAPIQMMGLAMMQAESPLKGLETYSSLADSASTRKYREGSLQLNTTQEQRAQSETERRAKREDIELQRKQALWPAEDQLADLEMQAAQLDLQTSRVQLDQARRAAEQQGGIDPKITQKVIADGRRLALDILGKRTNADGDPIPPSPEEVIKLGDLLAKQQLEQMMGRAPSAAAPQPWGAYSPAEQEEFIRDYPDMLKQYYPDVYGRMVMEGRIR